MAIVGLTTALMVLSIPSMLLEGWVLTLFWEWFVVPLGAPSVSVAQAMGLSLLVNIVVYQNIPRKDLHDLLDRGDYIEIFGKQVGEIAGLCARVGILGLIGFVVHRLS